MKEACKDCVEIFGYDPSDCPGDAKWRETYQEYLCEACTEDRDARVRAFKGKIHEG